MLCKHIASSLAVLLVVSAATNVIAHSAVPENSSQATTSNAENIETGRNQVSGSLALYLHKFENDVTIEYCLLTPLDGSEPMVVDTKNARNECEQAVSGEFSVAPQLDVKMNKDGCDNKYLPLCVESSYVLEEAKIDESKKSQKEMKASGMRSVLLISMNYQDKKASCSASCIENNMWGGSYNVDGLYNEATSGSTRFSKSSSRVVEVSIGSTVSSYNYCGSNGVWKIRDDANNKLAQQGISTSNYNHVVMQSAALCGVAVSQVGGSLVWLGTAYADAFAHELGHNLGSQHASLDTGDNTPASKTSYSTAIDYGDLSCIMGYSSIGLRGFNVPHRIQRGWIPSSSILSIPEDSCVIPYKRYKIASAELTPNNEYGYHAVELPRAKGGKYYISYKSGGGYDVNAPSGWKGRVFLHYTVSSTRTMFVRALQEGELYADESTWFRIRPVEMDGKSAYVNVVCGTTVASCTLKVDTNKQPSVSGTFSPTSKIGGYNAWVRSDSRAVIAFCESQNVWVVGDHDGSSPSSFNPCNNMRLKSAAWSFDSPATANSWYSCSSSCSQDTSTTVTVISCSASKSDQMDFEMEGKSSVSATAVTNPQCPYFESLCSKCQQTPSGICTYMSGLCMDCAE